jgi:hypothetical protein
MQYFMVRHNDTNRIVHTEPNLTKHETLDLLTDGSVNPFDYYVTEWAGDGADDDIYVRRINAVKFIEEGDRNDEDAARLQTTDLNLV